MIRKQTNIYLHYFVLLKNVANIQLEHDMLYILKSIITLLEKRAFKPLTN